MLSYKETKERLEKYFYERATIGGAEIVGSQLFVTKTAKVPSADKDNTTNQVYRITPENTLEHTGMVSLVEGSILASAYSDCGTKRAFIREKGENCFIIEVFEKGVNTFRRELKDKYKAICTSPYLTTNQLIWNKKGTKFMFVAERITDKELKPEEAFDSKVLSKFAYQPNLGETITKFYDLDFVLVDLSERKVSKINNLPSKVVTTMPSFLNEEGTGIVFCGFDSERFLSGVVFCDNKPSTIYVVRKIELTEYPEKPPTPAANVVPVKKEEEMTEAEKEKKSKDPVEPVATPTSKPGAAPMLVDGSEKVSTDFPVACFPIAHPSGDCVLYFFSRKYREHHKFTLGLAKHCLKSNKTEVLVDSEEADGKLAYYVDVDLYAGLHWVSNTEVSFKADERGISIQTFIDIESKQRRSLKIFSDFELDFSSVLAVNDKYLVISLNNLYYSGRLGLVVDWTKQAKADSPKATFVWEADVPKCVDGEIEELPLTYQDVTGYLWRLKKSEVELSKRPLLMVLHGGPHASWSCFNSPYHAMVLEQGFQIMTVNFSGSYGFGKQFNERLAGKIGELDIEEILAILKQLDGKYDKDQLFFDGGSYSGYQSFVFLQKHPHLFKGIVSRNPVVDLIYSMASTDIPEWNWIEALGECKFDCTKEPTDDQILTFKKFSPALNSFDPTSKTKVLLILGDSDKRVPPGAAYALYRRLKAQGQDIQCLVFPGEGHRIAKSKHVFDIMLNVLNLMLGFK